MQIHHDAKFEVTKPQWCVFEVYMHGGCIYVGAAPLFDAVTMTVAVRNSELQKLRLSATEMQVRIIATDSDAHGIKMFAQQRLRQFPTLPHCNKYGTLTQERISNTGRTVQTNDGRTFKTQQEAAEALGLHQPAVSRLLRSGRPNRKGLMLTWGLAA